MNIELHIEELVLHGFERGDRAAIGEAVRAELGRLLGEREMSPLLAGGGEVGVINGGAFNVRPDAKAGTIGTQIANTVHGGLSK